MLYFRSLIKTIAIALMVAVGAALHAQDGLSDAFARASSSCNLSSGLLGPSVVTADFNNDSYPDGAILFRNRNTFRIEVHFRFQAVSRITFDSSLSAVAISAVDVNHDGSADLVVDDPFSHHRLFVWLNDGHGAFHAVRVDDFPMEGDERQGFLDSRSQRPDSRALAVPAKLRVHQPSAGFLGFWNAPRFTGFNSNASLNLHRLDTAPQLLRGPPPSISL